MNKKTENNQKNQRIQVFARCRPLNSIEKKQFSPSIVEVVSDDNKILVKDRHTNREFKFDRFDKVFPPDAKQISVYKAVVEPLIKEVLMGYNCTVFAYGQTGTGKTYTMEGERNDSNCSWENDPGAGIIPRSIHQLFEELDKGPKTEFSVRVSFLELYNEELFDLLSSNELSRLRLFEDSSKKGSVIIQGLEEIVVNRKDEVYSILEKGASRRQTAATLLNASSSRSHTVFSVTVHIKETTDDGEDLLKTGKLNLVDLAGSENVGRSGAVDKRAREAGNINQSLLTLGRVITALIDKQPHVPYRESKLTRLLQDSLGGRTKTSIIATISPALCNFDETISTLDYATKAQKITIKPEVNQKMTKRALIKEYTEEIERLRKDLVALRSKEGFYIDSENYANLLNEMAEKSEMIKELSEKLDILNEEKAKIEDLFKSTKEELIVVSEKRNEISQKYKRTAAELSSTTNVLNKTKQVLSETALERDERQFLINIQTNTEKNLSKQAQTLLHVATETTDDVKKLHAKIDRKSSIEKTNEEKCQEFRVNLPKQLVDLDDFVSQSEKQQANVLSAIKEELDEHLQSIQKTKQKKNEFSNQLSNLVESHFGIILTNLTSESESHTKWTNLFLENSKYQKEYILVKLKSFMLEILPQLTQELNLRNSEMENWFSEKHAQLSQKIEEQKLVLIYNSECRKKLLSSVKESLDDLCKNYEEIATNFELSLTARTKQDNSFQKGLDWLYEQLILSKNMSQKDILRKPELTNAVLKTQKMKSSLDALHKTEDILEENLSALNDFSSLVNISHKEEFSLMQEEIQQSQQKTIEELEKFTAKHQEDQKAEFSETEDAINKHLSSTIEKLQSNKKHFSEIKLSLMDCVETGKLSFNTQLEEAEKNIQNIKDKIKESESLISSTTNKVKCNLLKIDTACEKFISEDLQRDVPTGITPQRKNYYYPRMLASTSPHERILQRYRSQLIADTAVAVNLPLDSSFNELDELKESPAYTDKSSEATSVHNLSFSSDESAACETDSCHSSMSDLSIESGRNKENQKCLKKPSRLPKKVKCKTFAKPAPPSLRKPMMTSNLPTTEECDV